jgi:hypothetical protein
VSFVDVSKQYVDGQEAVSELNLEIAGGPAQRAPAAGGLA